MWACVLERCCNPDDEAYRLRSLAPEVHVLLRVSATCRAARDALRRVRAIGLSRAVDCNARLLVLFASARRVEVHCFGRACSLEEAIAANPGTEAHSTRRNLLQFVGTAHVADGPNQGGGVPAGPVLLADEKMARCLPFALCALPQLAELDLTDYDGCEDSTHQQTHALKTFLLALCDARAAGQLTRLRYVGHHYLDCSRTSRIIDSDAPEDAQLARTDGCLCSELLRGMPLLNLLTYMHLHGLCATKADKVRALLCRADVALGAPLEPIDSWPQPEMVRRVCLAPTAERPHAAPAIQSGRSLALRACRSSHARRRPRTLTTASHALLTPTTARVPVPLRC